MTKVKICGITSLDDALIAADVGADMLGFNFYEQSSRYIEPRSALEIACELPGGITKVGVFVNMELFRICELVDLVGLDVVQLHGDESFEFIRVLRAQTDAQVIKAFRVDRNAPAVTAEAIADLGANYVLLDSFAAGLFGGTGRVFDWAAAADGIGALRSKLFLAGGLVPENVAEAVRIVRPFAVDTASGVESSPGRKDAKKMEAFIRNAKNV